MIVCACGGCMATISATRCCLLPDILFPCIPLICKLIINVPVPEISAGSIIPSNGTVVSMMHAAVCIVITRRVMQSIRVAITFTSRAVMPLYCGSVCAGICNILSAEKEGATGKK